MLERIRQNKFLKSISILVTGSLLAQLVTILTAPIMTRLFSAESIGIYTYITTIAFLLLPVINGRYELAIVTEKDKEKVFALVKLCMYICLTFVVIFTVGLAGYTFIFDKFGGYREYFVFVPFLLLISGYISIVTSYNNRFAKYKLMSRVAIVRAVVMFLLIVLFGVLEFDVFGLLFAALFSNLASLKKQSEDLIQDINDVIKVNFEKIKYVAFEYKSFLLFSVPAAFMNSLTYNATNLCIESLYGMEILGYYSLAYRILLVPLSLISTNVSKVFFAQASKEFNETKCFNNSFIKCVKYLFYMSIPVMLAIYYFSPMVCSLFLGERWIVSGEYIRLLTLMFGVRFIVSPLSAGVLVLRMNHLEIIGQGLLLVGLLFSYVYSLWMDCSIHDFLFCYSTVISLVYVCWIFVIWRLSLNNK